MSPTYPMPSHQDLSVLLEGRWILINSGHASYSTLSSLCCSSCCPTPARFTRVKFTATGSVSLALCPAGAHPAAPLAPLCPTLRGPLWPRAAAARSGGRPACARRGHQQLCTGRRPGGRAKPVQPWPVGLSKLKRPTRRQADWMDRIVFFFSMKEHGRWVDRIKALGMRC